MCHPTLKANLYSSLLTSWDPQPQRGNTRVSRLTLPHACTQLKNCSVAYDHNKVIPCQRSYSDLPSPFTSENEPLHTRSRCSKYPMGRYQQRPEKATNVAKGVGGTERLRFKQKPFALQISSAAFTILSFLFPY